MISVIIVNYYSALLTKRAIQSITQERKDSEIFVVDNTCSHEEKQLLANSLEDDGVHLIFNAKNEGFAKACNTAYALSRGEYIFLLNPDAYILPGALTQLENFLARHPDTGAVGPKIYWDNDKAFMLPPSMSPSPANELFMQLTRQFKTFGLLYSRLYRWRAINIWRSNSPVKQNALSGGHVMLRRSAVEYSGGLFDERFFMYYEDSDLMYRLRKNGYTLYVEPKAGVIHNYTHNAGKMGLMAESRELYFNKHFRNNLMLFISDKLSQLKDNAPQYTFIDMKITDETVSINVPGPDTGEWLFEWSPNPFFIPSAGCFGKGAVAEFHKEAWKLLGPGIYFGRISNPACIAPRFIKWSWEITQQ